LRSVNRVANMNREKLMRMAGSVRTGGKGSVRRKHKAVHKATTTDDKRLQNTLKRLGVNTIPGIEEVNIFKDETVIHFASPKVQASIAANTYVVSGPSQNKKLQDLLPGIINQLGPDNLANLKKIAQQFAGGAAAGGDDDDDDDDVPELVENFEEASKKGNHEAPKAGQFSQGVSAIPTGKKPGSAGTGKLKLKVEISQCNIKKIDMKAYGIEKPVCQAFVKLNDQVFATSADYGLDPVWETSAEFGLNDPKTDKVSAVLYCQGMQIGDECTFLLDKLIKGKATYKGLIVPGGKVDMLFTAESFGLEKAEEASDDFMDFL